MHVVVVEGSDPVRVRLAALVREHAGAVTVEQASGVPKAYALIERSQPQLLIIGARLDEGSGFELLRALRREQRPAHVIMLCGQLDAGYLFAARSLGVDYLLESPRDLEILPRLLRFVASRARSEESISA